MFDGMDLLGSAVVLKTATAQQRTMQLTEEILRLQQEKRSGPPCPYCGEPQKNGEYELCWNCHSKLVWIEGHVCEPGREEELRARLKTETEDRKRSERERLEHEARLAAEQQKQQEQQSRDAYHSRLFGLVVVLCLVLALWLSWWWGPT